MPSSLRSNSHSGSLNAWRLRTAFISRARAGAGAGCASWRSDSSRPGSWLREAIGGQPTHEPLIWPVGGTQAGGVTCRYQAVQAMADAGTLTLDRVLEPATAPAALTGPPPVAASGSSRWVVGAAALIVMAGAAIRFAALSTSIWFDESVTVKDVS